MTTSVIAEEPPAAEEVLQGRGLMRSGLIYVLREESNPELKARLGEVRALKKQWEFALTRLSTVVMRDMMIQRIDDESAATVHTRDEYQANINYIERNKWHGNRAYSLNSVQLAELRGYEALRDTCNARLNDLRLGRHQLQRSLPPPGERRKLEESLQKQSTTFGEKLAEVRRLIDAIQTRYDELAGDMEMKQALDTVRRVTRMQALRLGPSDEFRRLVRELEAYEKLLNAGAEGLNPRPAKAAVTRRHPPIPR
jgi:hypothetical protein